MRIIVDLDGTICSEERTYSRLMAKPIAKAVNSINKLYAEGNTIIIYSARSWQEYEMSVEWLKKHSVNYHQLILGKPIGDAWIDDRAIELDSWDRVLKKLDKLKKQ